MLRGAVMPSFVARGSGFLACILLLFSAACGSSDEAPTPPHHAASGSGGDAGAGGCAQGTHAVESGCDTTLTWADAGSVQPARDHHASFIAQTSSGAFLYVLGGMNATDVLADAQRAAIESDGSLGSWQQEASLPMAAAGHGLAVANNVVVVTGGFAALSGQLTAATFVTRIGDDGALAPWTAGPNLPSPRVHHTMVAQGSWIYAIGGLTAAGSVSEVLRATVNADGSIGTWEKTTALPAPRSHHASIVHGGALYVIGGANLGASVVPYTNVLRAPIAGDGSIGVWSETSKMPSNIGAQAVIEFSGDLYSIGGIAASGTGLSVLATVLRAPFLADGTLPAWEQEPSLPMARGHVHETPLFEGRVYSVAGQAQNGDALSTVLVGTFE